MGLNGQFYSSIRTIELYHTLMRHGRSLRISISCNSIAEKLRVSSKFSAPQCLSQDGENLAAVLAHLIERDADVEQMVSNDLASIVPGATRILSKI